MQAIAIVLLLPEEALNTSNEFGTGLLWEKVMAMNKRGALLQAKKTIYSHRLTKREVEVLSLVASGMSNRGIATQLVLSIRTVERHITNIYRKINAHSRGDAVVFALEHGMAQRPPQRVLS